MIAIDPSRIEGMICDNVYSYMTEPKLEVNSEATMQKQHDENYLEVVNMYIIVGIICLVPYPKSKC